MRFVLPLLALAAAAAVVPAADTRKIDAAIKRGADYLRGSFDPSKKNAGGTHGAGTMALCGLAMLETGVKPDDPSLKYITEVLRAAALAQTETYHVSLCVLYFDRLGDPADVPVIQMLGVRLYAGLGASGSFSYQVWDPVDAGELTRLQGALQKRELLGGEKKPDKQDPKDDGFLKPTEGAAERAKPKLHSEASRILGLVKQTIQARGRGSIAGGGGAVGSGDNSNTQFGLIGLWVAGRHGVPIKDAMALIEAYFLATQNTRDGGWGYNSTGSTNSTVAMTCAGLLGLAIGGAARDTARATPDKKGGEKVEGAENDPFFNPKKGDGEKAEPAVKARPSTARDRAAEAALKAIGSVLVASNGVSNFVGLGNAMYTLWSVERMAVAYQLETIGGVDWYDYGSTIILGMQGGNGAFNDGQYGEDINTALALLFLAKANFTKDLGAKKHKDPGKVELRGGGAQNPLTAPPREDKDRAKRGAGGAAAAGPNDTPAPPKGGIGLPEVEKPTEATEAEKVAKALTGAANEAEFTKQLTEARDTKGAKWTKGLVLAAARLDGEKRRLAREALAERLVRMTPATLQQMLRDKEAELRRAAVLACGMRDEKAFIPDLIERITDPSDVVVRAARASLVSLGGVDFGPKQTDDDSKLKASAAWSKWHEGQSKK